jgi:hypothetical protein
VFFWNARFGQGVLQGIFIGIEPETAGTSKEGIQRLPKTPFRSVGQGGKESPFGAVFHGTE